MGLRRGVAIAVLTLLPAAPALAEEATVGSSLGSAGSLNLCASGFECIAFTTNNGAPVAVVPFDGVVTKWRVRAGSATSPVKLRVLRPAGGGTYTAAGTSAVEMTTAGSTPDEFTSSLPVQTGDVLALSNDSSALLFASAAATFSVNWFQAAASGQPALADGTSGTPGNTMASREVAMNATVVRDQADLSLTLSDSPDPVGVGQDLTYLLTIANAGPRPAKAVSVSDSLPAGVTAKSATPSTGTCATTPAVTCDLGTMASGKTETVAIVVTPGSAGSIADAASVTSGTQDPDGANNAATVTTTVNAEPVTTPPVPSLSSFAFSPPRFRLGSFLPTAAAVKKKPPVGTTISYVVADAKTVTLRYARLRKGKSAVLVATVTRKVVTGINRIHFSGRFTRKKALRAARYRVTAVAKGDGGRSAPQRATITVLKH